MAFVSLRAWRARSAERAALASRLKKDLRAALGLGEADTLAINEIACADPGCPDMETIVLVMRVGTATRALRIRRPLDAVGTQGYRRAGRGRPGARHRRLDNVIRRPRFGVAGPPGRRDR